MYRYIICNEADEEIFNKQCAAIEKHITPIKKGELLIDVDGSKTQIYLYEGQEISVINSCYTNDVTISSEIDIKRFF